MSYANTSLSQEKSYPERSQVHAVNTKENLLVKLKEPVKCLFYPISAKNI